MTTPAKGDVPAQFLIGIGSGIIAELNTGLAFTRLYNAHPKDVHTNGLASGYWTHQIDVEIHTKTDAMRKKYNISVAEQNDLAPIGTSTHLLGTRLNFSGVSESVAAQFGFRAFNAYTFDYTGVLSWDQAPGAEHNLTTDEVKRVASYLNSRNLGRTTTANSTGVNVTPGSNESNYYWEIQRAGKIDGVYPSGDLLNGIPGPATYAAELHYRDLTSPAAPVAAPTTPSPTVAPLPDSTPVAPSAPSAPVSPTPPPAPVEPSKGSSPVTIPTESAAETVAKRKALIDALNADSAELAAVAPAGTLSGLLAAKPTVRKRFYVGYAITSLALSCGSDVVTYVSLSAHTNAVLVASIGLGTSVLLKIGAAFGLVAANNTK